MKRQGTGIQNILGKSTNEFLTSADAKQKNKYLEQYKNLNDLVVAHLKELLDNYSSGDFEELKDDLTHEKYFDIALRLTNESILSFHRPNFKYDEKYFAFYKDAFYKVLDGLKQSIGLNATLNKTLTNLEFFKEKAALLDDMEALQEYLEQKKTQFSFIPDQYVTAPLLIIKPEYLKYAELYGWPEKGAVFDSKKLANIIKDLIAEGVITSDCI